ncbi:MAG: winged helix DNA-binding domain-containing protein [Chloroflexota bacterium]|nr:winged helix DNA-binding domain-containing protein [Chloroflexota bacterium]
MKAPSLSPQVARRLAVRAALLEGPRPAPDREGIMAVVRGLGSLQIDPTRAVERTHLLVLWSRLGPYDPRELDRLRFEDRRLYEYAAFLRPTESYPEQAFAMERFATRDGAWERRVRAWMAENDALRQSILERLKADGPLPSRVFAAPPGTTDWKSSGWTGGRNVPQMFELMSRRGEILVAGREGGQRLWDLAERVVQQPTQRNAIDAEAFADRRVRSAVARLGFADRREIRDRVPILPAADAQAAIDRLIADGTLQRVSLQAEPEAEAYMLADEIPLIDYVAGAGWRPRTTLLSPFDPLIRDRERTERLFGFHFRLEMYVPRDLRKFGFFVLPILHGDRLIGRVNPKMDRRRRVLDVTAVHVEPDAPVDDPAVGLAVGDAIRELGTFLRAREVRFESVPQGWRAGLEGGA